MQEEENEAALIVNVSSVPIGKALQQWIWYKSLTVFFASAINIRFLGLILVNIAFLYCYPLLEYLKNAKLWTSKQYVPDDLFMQRRQKFM